MGMEAQRGHTVSEWQRQDLNTGLELKPEAFLGRRRKDQREMEDRRVESGLVCCLQNKVHSPQLGPQGFLGVPFLLLTLELLR